MLESELTRSMVYKLPQPSLLAVRKFRTAGEERYEQSHGPVCVNL